MSFVTDKCEKCGADGPGDYFQYFYGRPLSTEITGGAHLGTSIVTVYTTKYQVLGGPAAFLCKACTKKRLWGFIFGPICYWALLFLLLGLIGLYLSGLVRTQEQAIQVYANTHGLELTTGDGTRTKIRTDRHLRDAISEKINLAPLPRMADFGIWWGLVYVGFLLVSGLFITVADDIGDKRPGTGETGWLWEMAIPIFGIPLIGLAIGFPVFPEVDSSIDVAGGTSAIFLLTFFFGFLLYLLPSMEAYKHRRLFLETWAWKLNKKRLMSTFGRDVIGWNTAKFSAMTIPKT